MIKQLNFAIKLINYMFIKKIYKNNYKLTNEIVIYKTLLVEN